MSLTRFPALWVDNTSADSDVVLSTNSRESSELGSVPYAAIVIFWPLDIVSSWTRMMSLAVENIATFNAGCKTIVFVKPFPRNV